MKETMVIGNMDIHQLEGQIHFVEALMRTARKNNDTEIVKELSGESAELRSRLQDLRLFEREASVMVEDCDIVYRSKDSCQLNNWLESSYNPFRNHWIDIIGEEAFCTIWNRLNRANKSR